MAANLKGRLARIRKLGLVKATELAPEPAAARRAAEGRSPADFLEGWDRIAPMAWTRTLRFPNHLPDSVDPLVFQPLHRRRRAVDAAAQGRIRSAGLRFFDLETTGLSGGTGTVAFLAAVGKLVDGEFELTQVFLEDYPGEGDFLRCTLPLLLDGEAIVSYNGRAFDLPLLRTRCVLNGIPLPEPTLHIDALFAARRLWKRVYGGASLGLLEREVLGVERTEDLPGALIPEAWLSYARLGESPVMKLVMSHNADDILGLSRLLGRLQSIFDDPRSRLARADVDRSGLGRSLIAAGRAEEGEELLEAAAGDGDARAGILLSKRYRREVRPEDGARVALMLPATYHCSIEKAKTFERLVGDFPRALIAAKEAEALARNDAERESSLVRVRRIERKLLREN